MDIKDIEVPHILSVLTVQEVIQQATILPTEIFVEPSNADVFRICKIQIMAKVGLLPSIAVGLSIFSKSL